MANRSARIGMGQMLVVGGDIVGNLDRARTMIMRAADARCHLIVLPECLDVGWTCPESAALAEPIPGSTSDALCQWAKDGDIYVVAGITERSGEWVYNSAILVSPDGEIMMKHRKINLLDIEQPYYATGDSLKVVDTSIGKVAILICADNFPDSLVLGHSLARMGAEMILSPCAWAVPPHFDQRETPYGDIWREAYTRLAQLYQIPVVGVSNVGRINSGPWAGDLCIGCSLAVDHKGNIAATGQFGENAEQLLIVDLELVGRPVTGTDWMPLLRERGLAE